MPSNPIIGKPEVIWVKKWVPIVVTEVNNKRYFANLSLLETAQVAVQLNGGEPNIEGLDDLLDRFEGSYELENDQCPWTDAPRPRNIHRYSF